MRRDQLAGSYVHQSATPHRQGASSSRQVMTGDRCNERCKSVVKSVVICALSHFFAKNGLFLGFGAILAEFSLANANHCNAARIICDTSKLGKMWRRFGRFVKPIGLPSREPSNEHSEFSYLRRIR